MFPLALSKLEAAVLEWIASRFDDPALKKQLDRAMVSERTHTGVGCYSTLAVPCDTDISVAAYACRGPLSGPYFESPVVEMGGGTLLWFEGGRPQCLEIYANGDYFPVDHAELGEFKLFSGPEPNQHASPIVENRVVYSYE